MAMSTECQTPDAQYRTHIDNNRLSMTVEFGREIPLNEQEARLLENNLHNAIELVLARYYAPGPTL